MASLFGPGVQVSVASLEMSLIPGEPDEETAVVGAVASRRAEFRAGRSCARTALSRLGLPRSSIPVGPDRLPQWPAEVVGSITHCPGFCGAAVARRADYVALGFDAETRGAVDPRLAPRVAHADERRRLLGLGVASTDVATIVFSAKEAFYKAYYPQVREFLAFEDVVLSFVAGQACEGEFCVSAVPAASAHAAFARSIVGRWRLSGDLVICAAIASPISRAPQGRRIGSGR